MAYALDKINAALSTRLQALNLPTQWENAPFTPTAGAAYLIETILPAQTVPYTVNGQTEVNEGIYQVTVMAPKGATKGAGLSIVKQVADHFPVGLELSSGGQSVKVQSVSQHRGMADGDRWAIPISIRWFAAS